MKKRRGIEMSQRQKNNEEKALKRLRDEKHTTLCRLGKGEVSAENAVRRIKDLEKYGASYK